MKRSLSSFDLYKELDFNDEQSRLLSEVSYSNHYLSIILKYRNNKNELFFDSFSEFIKGRDTESIEKLLFLYLADNCYDSDKKDIMRDFGGKYFADTYLKGIDLTDFIEEINEDNESEGVVVLDELISGSFVGDQVLAMSAMTPMGLSETAIYKTGSAKGYKAKLKTDSYEKIVEKGYRDVSSSSTSQIKATCNTASINIIKNNLLKGYPINKDMVRSEELLNYFNYDLTVPETVKFYVTTESTNINDKTRLFIGIQGNKKEVKGHNMVVLLDVSGSMSSNSELTQMSLITILKHLKDGDTFSLITYSNEDEIIYDSIKFSSTNINVLIDRLLEISISGCTNGSAGLNKAYDIIKKNYNPDLDNRVILLTDGDFNFGDYRIDDIKELILNKRKIGAYMTLLGYGISNYKDDLMETLAKNGNGNYTVVCDAYDIHSFIHEKFSSLTSTIAEDVKVQVEFNPKYVKQYRLLGYENRELTVEEFKDDKVIAEPFNSEGHCIAYYDIVLKDDEEIENDLRYQEKRIVNFHEMCAVKITYTNVDDGKRMVLYQPIEFELEDTDYNSNLAFVVNVVCEMFRNSEYLNKDDIKIAEDILESLITEHSDDEKLSFLRELYYYGKDTLKSSNKEI